MKLTKSEPDVLHAFLRGKPAIASIELGLLSDKQARMPASIKKRVQDSLSQSLFAGGAYADATNIGPLLLQVEAPDIDWLVEVAEPRHAVSWIIARAPLTDLRESLAEHLVATDEEGSRFLLRYYDPRVLEPYIEMVDVLDWAHTLRAVESWHWVNPWGMACTLQVPQNPQAKTRTYGLGCATRKCLNPGQMQALTHLCEPGALLDQLRSRVPKELAQWAAPSEHALASYLLRVAYAHGLHTFYQQVAYALDAMWLHPLMHTHPWFQTRLSGGASLENLADNLNPKQREVVLNDLTLPEAGENFSAPFGYAHQKIALGNNGRIA